MFIWHAYRESMGGIHILQNTTYNIQRGDTIMLRLNTC